MDDKAIRAAARAGAVGIIETAGVDGRHGVVPLGDAARRVAFLIHVFRRRHFDALRVGDFQQKALEAARFDLLQIQGGVGTGRKGKQLLLRRRADAAQYLVDFFLRKKPRNVLGMAAL